MKSAVGHLVALGLAAVGHLVVVVFGVFFLPIFIVCECIIRLDEHDDPNDPGAG